MGRKTWQSAEVGCRPYKDRYTFVISKTMKKEKHEDLVPVRRCFGKIEIVAAYYKKCFL